MSNDNTIANLQKALQMEMTASHQYQLHAHVLDDWGLDKLAAKMREEFAEETEHSNKFMERIIFLGGTPEIEFQKKPVRAKDLKSMFQMDLEDEDDALAFYTKASKEAFEVGDLGTRRLFETIAIDEEGHKDWLELQIDLIDRIGEQNYASKYVTAGAE